MINSESRETSQEVNAETRQEGLAGGWTTVAVAEVACNSQIRLYLKNFKDRVFGIWDGLMI